MIAFDAEFRDQALNRSATYALFANLLQQEVSLELLQRIRQADREQESILTCFLAESGSQPDHQLLTELAADFAGLFLNAGDHPVYPYQSVYTSPERLLMQAARDKVRETYAASSLERSTKWNEPEDHIALELEFMSHLCLRAAKAIEAGNLESSRELLKSQDAFLGDHLLAWAPQFCLDLERSATTGFYRALAGLLRSFLELEKTLIAERSAG